MDDQRPGGYDPKERISEMETDGVSAEVLYPTLGLRLFSLESPEAQEACFRIYNDWLMEYCSIAPKRLVGIPVYLHLRHRQGCRRAAPDA